MSTQVKAQVDKLLTGVSNAPPSPDMICETAMPVIRSKQYSGLLGKYGKNHLRIVNTIAGGRGKYRFVQPIVTGTTNFNIDSHGLEGMVTKRDYANKELPFDAEKDETMGLTSMLMVEKEVGFSTIINNTSIITQNTTLSGTSQFTDYVNSDPLNVFKVARKAVKDGCGMRPNVAIMAKETAEVLKYHPQLLDYLGFKIARPGGLTEIEIASALDVKKVLVSDAQYNSAKEGQADNMVDIYGKGILFAVLPEKAEVNQVSLGYMVRLEGSEPRKVYKAPINNPPGSTQIIVEDEYDMLISDTGAGYLIADAIA